MNPENVEEKKWYLKWWSVFIWFITLGPFALPFLWKSKDFNLFWKWFWTLFILSFTVALAWSSWKLIKLTIEQFQRAGLA